MADVSKLVNFVLRWEGGFQNMKEDRGNYYKGKLIGTNMGVTPGAYVQAFGKVPSVQDMKNLTHDQFTHILKKLYWDYVKADQIKDQKVANLIVDFAWASGTVNAVKRIQKVLGLTPDGIVGPKTLAAFNDPQAFDKIYNYRISYVESIVKNNPSQAKFLKGWKNRIQALK